MRNVLFRAKARQNEFCRSTPGLKSGVIHMDDYQVLLEFSGTMGRINLFKRFARWYKDVKFRDKKESAVRLQLYHTG